MYADFLPHGHGTIECDYDFVVKLMLESTNEAISSYNAALTSSQQFFNARLIVVIPNNVYLHYMMSWNSYS